MKLGSKFVINQQSKTPSHLKHGAIILPCDLLSITMHVSVCLPRNSVVMHLKCGEMILNYHST